MKVTLLKIDTGETLIKNNITFIRHEKKCVAFKESYALYNKERYWDGVYPTDDYLITVIEED